MNTTMTRQMNDRAICPRGVYNGFNIKGQKHKPYNDEHGRKFQECISLAAKSLLEESNVGYSCYSVNRRYARVETQANESKYEALSSTVIMVRTVLRNMVISLSKMTSNSVQFREGAPYYA